MSPRRTRSGTRCLRAFNQAAAMALAETSSPVADRAPDCSAAMASAPVPVPTSSTSASRTPAVATASAGMVVSFSGRETPGAAMSSMRLNTSRRQLENRSPAFGTGSVWDSELAGQLLGPELEELLLVRTDLLDVQLVDTR